MTSRGGLVWLAETVDGSGLVAGFEAAMRGVGRRRHSPGRTLGQVVLALADGAQCLSDLAVVRAQPTVFGPTPSEATVWRTFESVGPVELAGIDAARAEARERAWAAGAGPTGDELVIDLDSTVITTGSDKQDAAGTYKRTFGHHPLLAVCPDTGEVLAGVLRPGNAGTSTAVDHVQVLDAAIGQLPDEWADGHRLGDDPAWAAKNLLVRTDSAGATHWLAEDCRTRNIEFSLGYAIDQWIRDALLLVQEEDWTPAVDGNGQPRQAAQVVELTDLVPLTRWPQSSRLIVRRERPHPGAQLSLFDDMNGWRHTAFLTDTKDDDIAALECRHRQRARAENIIRDTKAAGMARLPFDCVVNNDVWMRLCFAANDLLCWARRIGCDGPLRTATPKTIRHRLLHIAARITPTGRRLHLDQTWPWTQHLITAIHRTRTAFNSLTVTHPTAPQPAQ